MSGSSLTGLSDLSMFELFCEEVRTHGSAFREGLSALREDLGNAQKMEPLMRAAHSIKGAGRIVNVEPAVLIAGAIEDLMIAAMNGAITLNAEVLPVLNRGVDLLASIAESGEKGFDRWLPTKNPIVSELFQTLKAITHNLPVPTPVGVDRGPMIKVEKFTSVPMLSEAPASVAEHGSQTLALTDEYVSVPASESVPAGVGDRSLLDLFREEVRGYCVELNQSLVKLEDDPLNAQIIEPLMRAAHSIKGAARIVNVEAVAKVAHAMEDTLVAAQKGTIRLSSNEIDLLLQAVDLLSTIASSPVEEFAKWTPKANGDVQNLIVQLSDVAHGKSFQGVALDASGPPKTGALTEEFAPGSPSPEEPRSHGGLSLLEMFREEVVGQSSVLNQGLVALESDPLNSQLIEPLMRAAHSLKGAARIVNVIAAERVAHVLEDVLVGAQKKTIRLSSNEIDLLLRGVDLLSSIASSAEQDFAKWLPQNNREVHTLIGQLSDVAQGRPVPKPARPHDSVAATEPKKSEPTSRDSSAAAASGPTPTMVLDASDVLSQRVASPFTGGPAPEERVVRVTANSLSRLMSLAGESLVEARWLQPFAKSLWLLKQNQDQIAAVLEDIRLSASSANEQGRIARLLQEARRRVSECRDLLADRIGEFDQHARQSDDLNSRLYYEVIASRMRPFADGVQGFPRMVRDLARKLGKKVKFEVVGHNTDVDRDILEKLEAPLNHILRNALDHGLETPEQRASVGKAEQGTLRLEARHRAGMLSITISDDGRGISLERLRRKIIDRGLSKPELVAAMTEPELLNFLFLPGFSTAERVTEVSGRGVGLDVVHSMVTAVGGSVRVVSKIGGGTAFYLQLPITLSVLRAVLVTIDDEPYAFPHNRIDRLLRLPRSEIRSLEGRQYFSIDGRNIGLVMAQQVFDQASSDARGTDLCVVLISDHHSEYGLVVDSFQGEQDLVVRPLDARLGKVPNVSAAALLEDGSPVLIVDVDDFLRSIEDLLQGGLLRGAKTEGTPAVNLKKRILVVDDSFTVREAERQLLVNRGYEVEVAVDGMDGWNTIRDADFDLVVSDVDMPRMNGLEFVKNIKQDPRLKSTPVVIVSYKGREEDRLKGLDAGADYYLNKGSFHDDTLLDAVIDLIGGPESQGN